MPTLIARESQGRNHLVIEVTDKVLVIPFGEDLTGRNREYHQRLNKQGLAIHGGEYCEVHHVVGGKLLRKYHQEMLDVFNQLPYVVIGEHNQFTFWWCEKKYAAEVRDALTPPCKSQATNGITPFWNY